MCSSDLDQQSRQRPGACAVGDQRARGGSHSRKVRGRAGDSQREEGDRDLGRNHQVQAVRRSRLAAGTGIGMAIDITLVMQWWEQEVKSICVVIYLK